MGPDGEAGPVGSVRKTLGAFRRGLKLIWAASPRLVVVTFGLQVVLGVSTVVAVVLAGRVLERMLEIPTNGAQGMSSLVGAFVLVTFLIMSASAVKSEYQAVLGELVEQLANDVVLDAAVWEELESYDSPEFYDKLNRVLENASWRPIQLVGSLSRVVTAGITIVGLGSVIATLSPWVLLIALITAAPLWWTARHGARLSYSFDVAQTERDRRHGYFMDALVSRVNAGEIRVFGIGHDLRNRLFQVHGLRIDDLRALARRRSLLAVLSAALSVCLGGFSLLVLVDLIDSGQVSVGRAAVVGAGVLVLAERLQALSASIGSLLECSLFLEDIRAFTSVVHSEDPLPAAPRIETLALSKVSFRYPDRRAFVLRDIDLEFQAGELVALVGENGSGKTTLARLMSMLYEPTDGMVLINGVAHKSQDSPSIRQRISVVGQDYMRLMLTVEENISLGATGDSIAHRVGEAARFASIDQEISGLEKGYETLLGVEFSGGHELSSGQWQRLAIARAWFRDADVLILDEPSSALDPGAEVDLMERIRRLAKEKLVILISHRFGTVSLADRILVLQDGAVVEQGTHDQLMSVPGLYSSLYSLQADTFR